MTITFTSDYSITKKGFKAIAKIVNEAKDGQGNSDNFKVDVYGPYTMRPKSQILKS